MKRCEICTGEFEPRRMGQRCCSPICELERKRQKKLKTDQRKSDKERRDALKSRREWLNEAQAAFNAYIRARDRANHYPCISCGRYHAGDMHAGHYRSVGAAPQLRFNEDNVHLQCAPCNTYLSGNAVEYRIRLIERIGASRVELLERTNEPRKYSIEEAKAIKETYKRKLKELQSEC